MPIQKLPTQHILDFMKGGALQKGSNPGFAHALQLTYNTIDRSRLSVQGSSLHYHYTTPPATQTTTGLLLAILDELTTTAQIAAKCPCPPGVTLHMQIETAVPQLPSSFTVVASARKIGSRMAFMDCSFYGVGHRLIAFGSQVKYLPTGSWLTDLAFTTPWMYHLYNRIFFASQTVPVYPLLDESKSIQDAVLKPLTSTLESATFRVGRNVTNPFGTMHVSIIGH